MQGIFPKEYFVYFEEKCRNRTESGPLSGHVDGFQMDPLSKGVKIRGTTLFRIALQCLFDAVTGAPGNGYLSTFRLRDHVRRPSPARFQLPGLSVRFCAVTLPILAFCGIVLLHIATKAGICQPFFPATPNTAASTGTSMESLAAPSPTVSRTSSPGDTPNASRAVRSLLPQRTWTKRFPSAPGTALESSTVPNTHPIIISIPPFGASVPRFRQSIRSTKLALHPKVGNGHRPFRSINHTKSNQTPANSQLYEFAGAFLYLLRCPADRSMPGLYILCIEIGGAESHPF